MVGGGVISGIMDMRNGSASFAAPEAIAQDLGAARIFEKLYGQNFGIGTGYIDALIPGSQSAVEIFAKIYAAFTTGRYNYPVGLLLSGKRWSPVQALIGIEIAKYIHRLHEEISVSDEDIPIDLIKSVGVGGNYLGEMHTALNFENNIWKTELFDRSIVDEKNIDFMIEKAKQKWADFLKKEIEPCISDEMEKEIQKWKKSAIRIIMGKNQLK
jgi:trimethylamine--corrinoid protein Co-methyltransferase